MGPQHSVLARPSHASGFSALGRARWPALLDFGSGGKRDSRPVIQDPDLTSDPRSGRIGARWDVSIRS